MKKRATEIMKVLECLPYKKNLKLLHHFSDLNLVIYLWNSLQQDVKKATDGFKRGLHKIHEGEIYHDD